MASIIQRKIKKYRRDNPYSHELLFWFLGAVETLVKIVLLGILMFALFWLYSYWQPADDSQSTQPVAQRIPAQTAKPNTRDTTIVSPAVTSAKVEEVLALSDPETTNISPVANAPIEIRKDQEGIDWISRLDPGEFIIQFASSADESALIEFSMEYLPGGAVVYPIKRTPSGRHVLGVSSDVIYDSLGAAQRALENMPSSIKQDNPWIRPARQVQRAISNTLG